MKPFLDVVRALPCWNSGKNNLINGFGNDSEVFYATFYSIMEFSCVDAKVRGNDLDELGGFARGAGITRQRQQELMRKVQIAGWDARETMRTPGCSFESFLDDFVESCMQDRKIQPAEYKMIYLVGKYLNLPKKEITSLLRTRFARLRYRSILFFERPWVHAFITVLIVLNAIQMGLMTCPWFIPYRGAWFDHLDFSFICIFTVEILCRIFAFRGDFFRGPQNVFDFVIVAVSWIPMPGFQCVSALRVLRSMLLLNRLGQLKSIMKSLLDALPNIGWISFLLFIFFYVFAVLTTNLFGSEFESFHSIERSFFSLFQLMTLEGWPDLVSSVMARYPYAWTIFIPFILITSYVFLNLVVGIIVTAMQDISLKKNATEKKEIDEIRELKDNLQDMARQMREMRKSLEVLGEKSNADAGERHFPPDS